MSAETIQWLSQTTPLIPLWTFLAQYSEPLFILYLLGLWGYWGFERRLTRLITPVDITTGLALAVPVSYLFRTLIHHQRPFATGSFDPLVPHEADSGFPSNHAVATTVFAGVYLVRKQWFFGTILAIIAGLVGCARVITGLHFPMDILGGWVLGGLASYVAVTLDISRMFAGEQTKDPREHPGGAE